MQKRTIAVDFFDVKSDFAAIMKGEAINPAYGNSYHVSRMREYAAAPERADNWIGGSPADTVRWMEKGYKAPEFKNAGKYVRDSDKKRRTFNDVDGDIDVDRLYSAQPNFFEKREKRQAKPGMTVNIEYAFASMVSAEDVRKFGAWIAGFCGSLEKQGFDLEVNVDSILENMMQGDRGIETTVRCNVKKRGQKSRFHSWSCLFAPTGYRHIMFHAYHVAGATQGLKPVPSLGHTLAGKVWGVNYDEAANAITITCNQRAKIDLDALNDSAQAAGLL